MAHYKYKSGKKNQKSYSHAQSQNGRKSSPSGDALEKEYHYWSDRMRHYFDMSFRDADRSFRIWENICKQKGLKYALHKLQERPVTFGKMRPYYIWGIWKSPYYYLRPKGLKESSRIADKWHNALNNFETYRLDVEYEEHLKDKSRPNPKEEMSEQEKERFAQASERARSVSQISRDIRTSWLEEAKRKVYGQKYSKDRER